VSRRDFTLLIDPHDAYREPSATGDERWRKSIDLTGVQRGGICERRIPEPVKIKVILADALIENPAASAYGRRAIAKRIPRNAEPGAEVVVAVVHAPRRQTLGAFLHHAIVGAARAGNDAAERRRSGIDRHGLRGVILSWLEVVLKKLAVGVRG